MASPASDSLLVSRRALLCAGCGSLVAADLHSTRDEHRSTHEGCTVGEAELRALPASWSPADMLDRLIPVSGDVSFDRALGRQLVRLARTFSVRPSFAYADDLGSMNAVASPVSLVRGTQGAVAFGIRMLRHLRSLGEGGDMAVLGVCAHEFGHVRQYSSDDFWSLRSAHPTAKLVELHADYLAGYFLARFKRERPHVRLRAYGEFLFQSGTFDYWSPEFHGTPQERVRAAEEGFRQASREEDVTTAVRAGRVFVTRTFG